MKSNLKNFFLLKAFLMTFVLLTLSFSQVTSKQSAFLSDNLMVNPGFEDGLDEWTVVGEVEISEMAFAGEQSAKICGDAYGSLGQLFPAVPGTPYMANFSGKVEGQPQAFGLLRFLDSNYTPIAVTSEPLKSRTIKTSFYKTRNLYVTAPEGTTYVHLIIQKGEVGCVYVDELSLYENISAPTSYLVANCIYDIVVSAEEGADGAFVDYHYGWNSPTACSPTTTTLSQGLTSGSFFPLGTTTVCWNIKNSCGDADNCCFNVIIEEFPNNSDPLILQCNDDLVVETVLDSYNVPCSNTTVVELPTSTTNDAMCGAVTVEFDGYEILEGLINVNYGTIGFCTGVLISGFGKVELKFSATDECGNSSTCSQIVERIEILVNEKIDLELSMEQSIQEPEQWSNYAVTLIVDNKSSNAAHNVKIKFTKPDGVVYVGGNEYDLTAGQFSLYTDEIWSLDKIDANSSQRITVQYFNKISSTPVAYAEVVLADEEDIDSTPNNGTPPTVNEDDEGSTISTESGGNKPDLIISELTRLSYIPEDKEIDLRFEVQNIGNAMAESVVMELYLSSNTIIDDDDFQFTNLTIGDLPAGIITSTNFGVNYYQITPGEYYIILKIDGIEAIEELNEHNNTIYIPMTITDPDSEEHCDVESEFPWHEWFSKININHQVEWTSGKSTYSDFSFEAPIATLERGANEGYVFDITYSYFTYQAYIRYYVDFNQNGIFEESEGGSVGQVPITPGSNVVATRGATHRIPVDAKLGVTKARFIISRAPITNACDDVAFGEIEDYQVMIVDDFSNNRLGLLDDSQFRIYPNPVIDELKVDLRELQGIESIAIYNTYGQLMILKEIKPSALDNGVLRIDMTSLHNGVYFIYLGRNGFKSSAQMIVVEHTD